MIKTGKVCPECDQEFKGKGWEGIDGHWKARHEQIMAYREAWPLISAEEYRRNKKPGEDLDLDAPKDQG